MIVLEVSTGNFYLREGIGLNRVLMRGKEGERETDRKTRELH